MRRSKSFGSVKGYYTRAKVFFYLMVAVAILYVFYSAFQTYFS